MRILWRFSSEGVSSPDAVAFVGHGLFILQVVAFSPPVFLTCLDAFDGFEGEGGQLEDSLTECARPLQSSCAERARKSLVKQYWFHSSLIRRVHEDELPLPR